ncbi:Uncharacterized protein FWK35_00021608, partial [Aphis craccivora]
MGYEISVIDIYEISSVIAHYQIRVRICNNNYKDAWLHPEGYDSMQTRDAPEYIREPEDQQQIQLSSLLPSIGQIVFIDDLQSTGTSATGRHLINRHHGLRRYDVVDSPTNAPMLGGTGRQVAPDEYQQAAGDRCSATCNVNAITRCYDRPCFKNDDRQPYHVRYVSPRPTTEIDRSSSPSPVHHRQRLQLNRRRPDTCEDDLQSTSA